MTRPQTIGRSIDRSMERSKDRTFDRANVQLFERLTVRTFDHSKVGTFNSSNVRLFEHSTVRAFERSIERSKIRTLESSNARSLKVRTFKRAFDLHASSQVLSEILFIILGLTGDGNSSPRIHPPSFSCLPFLPFNVRSVVSPPLPPFKPAFGVKNFEG